MTYRYVILFSLVTGCAFAQVTNVSPSKISLNVNGSTLKIPYYRNLPLSTTDPAITRAIIIVHGTNRNADDYYNTIMAATVQRPGTADSTIVIAPQFLTEEDINAHSLDNQHLYWSGGGWKDGSLSRNEPTNPRPERISSFAVTDTIMQRLASNLPSLRTIVVAGHSAGGQFVNRFTASSPMIATLCNDYGIPVKSIVANPSSYLYLSNERRKAGTVDQFEAPSTSCTSYDDYKYGLVGLYSYLAASGASQIRTWYGERKVIYLLGGNDNDPGSSSLDVSCEAMLQGDHRLERGTIFYHYIQHYYGSSVTSRHLIDTVPGVAHDNYGMFTSAAGLAHLFDYISGCGVTALDGDDRREAVPVVYPNPFSFSATLILPDPGYGGYTIHLYAFSGKLLQTMTTGSGKVLIRRNDLPSGIYFIEAVGKTGHVVRQRIIIAG